MEMIMSSPLFTSGCLIYGQGTPTVGLGNLKQEILDAYHHSHRLCEQNLREGAFPTKPYHVHTFKPFVRIHSHPFPKSVAAARENTPSFWQRSRFALSFISDGPVALNTGQKLNDAASFVHPQIIKLNNKHPSSFWIRTHH